MTSLFALLAVSLVSYVGTMSDNLLAFSAQLALTPEEKRGAVSSAQSAGVGVLVIASLVLGNILRILPLAAFSLCALAPWALAVQAVRHRHDGYVSSRRGVTATFVSTLALGGDNVAVWTPLLRAGGFIHGGVVLAVFTGCQILFVSLARRLVRHPRISQWAERVGHWVLPLVYVLLGVVILLETRVI